MTAIEHHDRAPAPARPGDVDPDELLAAPQVAKLLGLKSGITVHNYAKRPGGYFPAPDQVEETEQGRIRRRWKRSTITTWDQGRTAGNHQPTARVTAPRPPMPWQEVGEDESVTSGEAAAILGYADTGSFTSAYGQGNLEGLGDPVGPGATGTGGTPGRLWSKRRVLQEAEARWLRATQLQERRRLCDENLLRDRPLSVTKLHAEHPDLGTQAQWRSALNAARRAAALDNDKDTEGRR
jgi:hypothetical protein